MIGKKRIFFVLLLLLPLISLSSTWDWLKREEEEEEEEAAAAVEATAAVAAAEVPRVDKVLRRRLTVKDRCFLPEKSSWTMARHRAQGPKSNSSARAQ